MNAYPKAILAASISAILTACSSGSTSNDDGGPKTPDNTNNQEQAAVSVDRISLTGLAVKGKVRKAKVELFRVISGKADTTPLATGSTDSQGRYSLLGLSEQAYEGPALLKISYQTGAEMQCDSKNDTDAAADGCGNYAAASDPRNTTNPANTKIDFGEYFDLPTDFVMTSVIPRVNTSKLGNDVFTANVTSLTHIAAQYATGGNVVLSEETIRQFNNRVRFIFGLDNDVDIVSSTPGDITQVDNNTDAKIVQAAQYAALTAAIAQIATKTNKTVEQVLTEFANNFKANNGKLFWNSTGTGVNNSSGQITIADILAAAEAIAKGQSPNATTNLGNEKTAAGTKTGTENQNPPTAIPPANKKIIVGNQVLLDGGSVPASGVSYSWSQTAGPTLSGVTFPVAAQKLDIVPSLVGRYEFLLTVTSQADTNQSGSARVRVEVEAKPGAASLVAGKYSVLTGTADFAVNNPGKSDRSLSLEFGTERSEGIELKAVSGSNLSLVEDNTKYTE